MKQKRNMKKRKNNNNRFAFGLKNDAFRKNDLSIKGVISLIQEEGTMIDKLANQIAQWNRRELKLTETESKVIEFGLGVFLDVCVKFLILFMISVLIGKEVEFALCLLSFCGLRCWAGGVHCPTRGTCLLAMIALCFISLVAGSLLENWGIGVFVVLWGLCILILWLKAPGRTKTAPLLEAEENLRKRYILYYFVEG